MAIKKLCIPFISKDLVDALAIKDGKIGTYVNAGSFKRGTSPSPSPSRKLKLVTGITAVGDNWEPTGGPFDYLDFEDGSLNLVTITDFEYVNYIIRLGDVVYGTANAQVKATFTGDIVIHTENIQNNEQIEIGKAFKAFKLED